MHNAIKKGIDQKENLTKNPAGQIKIGLVGGIFIPQFDNPESALIHFRDPDWNEFNNIISEVDPQDLTKAIIRGSVIKQLYLAGANNSANELSNYVKGDDFKLSKNSIAELKSFKRESVVFSHRLKHPTLGGISHIKFSAKIEKNIFDVVRRVTSNNTKTPVLINQFSVTEENFSRRHDDYSWFADESEHGGRVISPQGISFKLNYKKNN